MLGDCCGLSFLKKIHRMGGTEPAALFDPPCFVDFATKTFRLHALKNRYGTTTYMTWRTTNLAIVARSRPLANARRCVVGRCLTRRTRCTPRRLPRLRRSRRRLCPWNPPPPPPHDEHVSSDGMVRQIGMGCGGGSYARRRRWTRGRSASAFPGTRHTEIWCFHRRDQPIHARDMPRKATDGGGTACKGVVAAIARIRLAGSRNTMSSLERTATLAI